MASISYRFADGHFEDVEVSEEFKEKYEFLLVREKTLRWKEMKQKERAGLKCSEDFSLHKFYEDGGDMPSSEHDPLEIIVKREARAQYKLKVLKLLTAKQLEVFKLYLDGYSQHEISSKLFLAASTVSERIKAAEKNIYKNFFKNPKK